MNCGRLTIPSLPSWRNSARPRVLCIGGSTPEKKRRIIEQTLPRDERIALSSALYRRQINQIDVILQNKAISPRDRSALIAVQQRAQALVDQLQGNTIKKIEFTGGVSVTHQLGADELRALQDELNERRQRRQALKAAPPAIEGEFKELAQ